MRDTIAAKNPFLFLQKLKSAKVVKIWAYLKKV